MDAAENRNNRCVFEQKRCSEIIQEIHDVRKVLIKLK
jgi:hypothetical protein